MTSPDLSHFVERIFENPELHRMGHNQCADDKNLGLGWIYYAMGRVARPGCAVVIGSWRGFVPMMIARALSDNAEAGEVWFIDPSMVDDFWQDATRTKAHFASYGLHNVRHFAMTTQQFVETDDYKSLTNVGLLFVDGYHTAEQAKFDHKAFANRLAPRAFTLFHDSMVERRSTIYGEGRSYQMDVGDYMRELAVHPDLQVMDFPFGTGLTMVRSIKDGRGTPHLSGKEGWD